MLLKQQEEEQSDLHICTFEVYVLPIFVIMGFIYIATNFVRY